MIKVGIDAVDIRRFDHWIGYTKAQLEKAFTQQEINYCRTQPSKAAERFAVRFAAKEACYKALSPLCARPLPFLLVARHCEVALKNGIPALIIQWDAVGLCKSYNAELSLTHTDSLALATVIIERICSCKTPSKQPIHK